MSKILRVEKIFLCKKFLFFISLELESSVLILKKTDSTKLKAFSLVKVRLNHLNRKIFSLGKLSLYIL